MTISTQTFLAVDVGASPNDGTGDSLRSAFIKVNANFDYMGNVGFDAANINVTGSVEIAGNISTGGANVTGSVEIAGNISTGGAQINTGYQKYSPTANIAITANVDVSRIIITPTSTVVSYGANITLPNITVDGTTIIISSNVAVEHLAVYGQWLSSVSPGANTAISAGGAATYFYSSPDVKWYKIG
jgi:hypothetical protein